MPRAIAVFGVSLLVFACLLLIGSWEDTRTARLRRALFVGWPLLEVASPASDLEGWRPLGGIEVVVRFPSEQRVAPETFRCLLNGRDVTEQLSVGRNGAGGHVYPLQEGTNELRFEVFGRGWWATRYFLDGVDVRVRARSPLGLDMG